MGAASTDNFCLRWNDFAENVSGAFKELRAESDFFDVTLACSDGGARTLQAHKVILSACSTFFKTTFRQQMNAHKHPNPYIYLRGVSYSDLVSILDFIYNGEVNVAQEDLNSFLAVAEELQIKGLTNRENSNSSANNDTGSSRKTSSKRPAMDTPPVKKVRKTSPAPAPMVTPTITPVAEEKEHSINIKDDPEAVLASTSAVNPDDAADFAGEDFDESYDGYYEDEGGELGESGEGTDGTKGKRKILGPEIAMHMAKIDGIWRCITCATNFRDKTDLRRHVESRHLLKIMRYRCNLCNWSAKTSHAFRKHQLRHEKEDQRMLEEHPLDPNIDPNEIVVPDSDEIVVPGEEGFMETPENQRSLMGPPNPLLLANHPDPAMFQKSPGSGMFQKSE